MKYTIEELEIIRKAIFIAIDNETSTAMAVQWSKMLHKTTLIIKEYRALLSV